MKNHETGQGLVEYTLILVLVAIAALMMMISQLFEGLENQVDEVYCQIVTALGIENEVCQDDLENSGLHFDNLVWNFSGLVRFPANLSAVPAYL